MNELLTKLEGYFDGVPRSACRAESIGPFTLFVNEGSGWPYYARPSLGASQFSPADVQRVVERQKELGIPQAFEWVEETTPGLRGPVEAAGLTVHSHPLLVLPKLELPAVPSTDGISLRLALPEDDVATLSAVAIVGFSSPGTATGPEGADELASVLAHRSNDADEFVRDRLRRGLTVTCVAYDDRAPVCVGSHQPVDGISEVVGVATLPAFRRRGIAAAVVHRLLQDALERGVNTVFISAGDDNVARIYEHVGFRRTATACVAEAAEG